MDDRNATIDKRPTNTVTKLSDTSFGRHRLPLALLASCLFHVLVISFAYFGKVNDREGGAKELARQSVLGATVLRLTREVQAAPVAPKMQRPGREPVRGASRSSANKRDQVAPELSSAERLNSAPIPSVDYYPTNVLTAKPQPLGEVALDPEEIAARVASGRIVLVLWINEGGTVVKVNIKHSDLPDVFSQVAVKAFQTLQFTPGELNGQKVGARMQVEVSYDDDRLPEP
jgi:TonB family protein